MAVNLSDGIKTPYDLGKCVEDMYYPTVKCNAGETDRHPVIIHVRRRGDLSYIILPEIIYKTKPNDDEDDDMIDLIKFTIDDRKNIGEHPLPMEVMAVGWNKGNIGQVVIHMDEKGYFMMSPEDLNEGFDADGGPVGVFSTLITFIPNDESE